MKNSFDKGFEARMVEKLKSLEITPPNDLWDDIEAILEVKRRRKIFVITSWVSAATIALLFTIGGFYAINSNEKKVTKNESIRNVALTPSKINQIPLLQLNPSTANESKQNGSIVNRDVQKVLNPTKSESSALNLKILNRNDDIPVRLASLHSTLKENEIIEKISFRDYPVVNINSNNLARVEPKEGKAKGKWFVLATAFPVYSFHTNGIMNQTGLNQEAGIVSWGGSISVRYALPNRISFETGITYSSMGQQERNLYLVPSDASIYRNENYSGFSSSYGVLSISSSDFKVMSLDDQNVLSVNTIVVDKNIKVNATQQFRYIEIPLLLSKGFKVKSINLNLKAGLSAGFLVGNHLDIRGSNVHLKGKTIGVDPFTTSALASVGFSIPIVKSFNLLVEPSFKLGLNSISSGNTKNYPFATYIKFGVEVPI